MEPSAKTKAQQCRSLATYLRTAAGRTEMPGFASRMLGVAAELEQQAEMFRALIPPIAA
jgi:hypothetical protein